MHPRRALVSASSALVLVALLAASGFAADGGKDASRRGWHGETMPEGLERTDAEGEYRWTKDGAIMVYVPAGPFPMGSQGGAADERPVHTVHLSAFYIDQHEVSWARYQRSGLPVSETSTSRVRQPRPPDWGIVPEQPALNVSWNDAVTYADWAGKRLPTEAEWEKAARGTDGRTFPWGSEPPTPERAVWRDHPIASESTAPVTCCEAGASPYGVLNLAGNVYEWCADVYERDYYSRSPAKDPRNDGDPDAIHDRQYRVLRGGAFVLEVEDLRSAYRYRLYAIDRAPYLGFRTVLPAVADEEATAEPETTP